MVDALAVWLYDERVAVVERPRKGRLRLRYTQDALTRYEPGTPLLSLRLPLRTEPYPNQATTAFLDGLLPEGEPRRAVAEDLNLLASDTFGLLEALGRDCAGALVILPKDDSPPVSTTRTASRLSDSDVAELVRKLRGAPLGIDADVRLSLAGVQEKLLLTRMEDGSWGRPVKGTPSTHILKPEHPDFPNTVENEAFCMRFARHLSLPVASVETIAVEGRKLIVVERYDRIMRPNGGIDRVHQEDLCQALGILPASKYQQDGGPSLRQAAELLGTSARKDSTESLLRAVTLNVLLGNGDAHGKNFSIVHERDGEVRLAPLYDLLSTLMYGDDRLAMYIDDVQRTRNVTASRIQNEAASWGISRARASEIVADLVSRAEGAAEAAANETPDVPEELLEIVGSRVTALRESPRDP